MKGSESVLLPTAPVSRANAFSQLFLPFPARARPPRPFLPFDPLLSLMPFPSFLPFCRRSPRGDGVGEWEPVSRRLGGGRALGRLHVQRQRLDLPREVGGPQLGNHLLRQHLPRHAHSLPGDMLGGFYSIEESPPGIKSRHLVVSYTDFTSGGDSSVE